MKVWRRAQLLWAGLALLLATNAVVLAGVLYNRSGEPEAVFRLSQRELELPYRSGFERENSGISLELRWRVARIANDEPLYYTQEVPWLDGAKLAQLGFDMSRSPATLNGARHYAKVLPREVFLVLELDGPSYRDALQRAEARVNRAGERAAANPAVKELARDLDSAKTALDAERNRSSRLFVIDAGRDSGSLRSKYAERSRYAIVPGTVRLTSERRGSFTVPIGYVSGVSVDALNVPAAYRARFAAAYRHPNEALPQAGNYEVTVAFGKRLEPWIVEVRPAGK